MLRVERLQGKEICRDIFSNGGVRATAGFDGGDAVGREGIVRVEEVGIFAMNPEKEV